MTGPLPARGRSRARKRDATHFTALRRDRLVRCEGSPPSRHRAGGLHGRPMPRRCWWNRHIRHWSRTEILEWLPPLHADEPLLIGFDFTFSPPFASNAAPIFPARSHPTTPRAFWAYVDAASADSDLGAASLSRDAAAAAISISARRTAPRRTSCISAAASAHGTRRPAATNPRASMTRSAPRRSPRRASPACGCCTISAAPSSGLAVRSGPRKERAGGRNLHRHRDGARLGGLRKSLSKFRDGPALDAALAAIGSKPHVPLARYTDHATDAILTAAWLRANAERAELWRPPALTREIVRHEGWTFGVV